VSKWFKGFGLLLTAILVACQPSVRKPPVTPAPEIRVLLKAVTSKDSIEFKGNFILTTSEARFVFGKKNKKIYLVPDDNSYRIFNQNRYLTFGGQDVVYFEPEKEKNTFRFQNHTYSGRLMLRLNEEYALLVINKLDLETYLRGVVPAEIPSEKKSYFEAIKAQAVCARTYALRRMADRSTESFDVFDNTQDQVYAGQEAARPLADQALAQTCGSVLMYGDSLAAVYYHSTCGGVTEAGGEVFAGLSVPYLKSTKDLVGAEFACRVSPKFRWQRLFSLQQIDSLFREKKHYSLLDRKVEDTTRVAFSVKVLERSISGRVKKLRLVFGDSTLVLEDYQIRDFFRDGSGRGLPSTLFYVKSAGDSLLLFRGGGYGHGVGMCQWGAIRLSEKGIKYYDILVNKYFPGTYLKRMY